MGAIDPNPDPALLFFSLLGPTRAALDGVCEELDNEFGPIVARSEVLAFSHSRYYEAEMGPDLLRQWALSDRLIAQDAIASIKRRSNEIEDARRRADEQAGNGRTVNIDPGYVNLAKVVLATTKDYSHRLYLRDGIYAEVTLTYRSRARGFEPVPWTYPDHAEATALRFFAEARERYRRRLREWKEAKGEDAS